MIVYVGADHRGFALKNLLREHLEHSGHSAEDEGALTLDKRDDYPRFAYTVASKVLGNDGTIGLLVCGSGQGMAMAANKVRGIRAALVWSPAEARAARHEDDANILVLPADMIDNDTAEAIVDEFLSTKFSGEERHRRRLEQIEELYG
jgi:ribose 5-phosphate isomerase B